MPLFADLCLVCSSMMAVALPLQSVVQCSTFFIIGWFFTSSLSAMLQHKSVTSCVLHYVHREYFSPILYLANFYVLEDGYCALFGLSSPIPLSFSVGPAFFDSWFFFDVFP